MFIHFRMQYDEEIHKIHLSTIKILEKLAFPIK